MSPAGGWLYSQGQSGLRSGWDQDVKGEGAGSVKVLPCEII